MSAAAIVMMIIAIAIVWGGLAVAIINLNRHETPGLDSVHRDL